MDPSEDRLNREPTAIPSPPEDALGQQSTGEEQAIETRTLGMDIPLTEIE